MLSDLRFRLRALLRRTAMDSDLDAELGAHLEHLTRQYEQAGFPRDEAERRARVEFGGLDRIAAECRDVRGVGLIESAAQDIRYGLRVLRKDALFSAIAAMTIAVGIGASVTIFSVVDAILLEPLPYPAPERIVLPLRLPPPAVNVGFDVFPWGRLEFLALESQGGAFEHVGAFLGGSFNLTGRDQPARLDGASVSAGFFRVFGIAPQLGRVFSDDVDQPGRPHEVVLSDGLWRARFGSDPAIVGRAVILNGSPHTVVGVMPAGFSFPQSAGMPAVLTLPRVPALWVPLALSRGPRVRGEPAELGLVGRLRSTVSVGNAQAELDLLAARLDRELPQGKGWFRSRAVPIAEQLAGGARRPLLLLLAAVGVLLLIAWTNVSNLLLARAIARSREFTLRSALGAARGRLVRQLTAEHFLLAAVGGGVGCALAAVAIPLVRTFGPQNLPRLAEVHLNVSVLSFWIGLVLATTVALSVTPAWAASRDDLVSSLKDGGNRTATTASGSRVRNGLLIAEVALALVLMIASGLLARTFVHLTKVDAGFRSSGAMTFELTLPSSYSELDRIVGVYRAALERLRALPGVEAAGIGETVPMGGAGEATGLRIPDRPPTADQTPPYANYTIVSPGYLAAVGTPVLRGRDFLDADTGDTMPVAIVSDAMARKYWPGQDPIGKQVGVPINPFDMTVVGVVADVKHVSLREEPGPEIYVPFTQKPWPSMLTMHVVVRSKTEPSSIFGAVRNAVHEIDPDLPIAAVATLDAIVDGAIAQPRFAMMLISGLGVLSLLLACVGLYGAVAYSVTSRTQEIGIRLALGASRRRVLALVLGHGVRITSAGIGAGIVLALVALRAIAGFLYGIASTDVATFATLSGLLLVVASAACYFPARRAMGVDPIIAMRTD